MTEKLRTLTEEQNRLIAEISTTYGTEPDDITFFADGKPFLGFETSCVMLNRLRKPQSLFVEPAEQISADSVSHRCSVTFEDGSHYGDVGVANRNESDRQGSLMNDQQLAYTAKSRALRSTLRLAAVDLLKLHQAATSGNTAELQFTGLPKTNRARLTGEAHALGKEVGLIEGEDKTLWRRLMNKRYKVDSTALLSELELADWVAFLKSMKTMPTLKAAA